MRQRKARRDNNEQAILDVLKSLDISYELISMGGVPDILMGYRGNNYLIETKAKKGRLTSLQEKWHENWQGQKIIIRSVDEMMTFINSLD